MAIPKTKTYSHTEEQVHVETSSDVVFDPENGKTVKQEIDELDQVRLGSLSFHQPMSQAEFDKMTVFVPNTIYMTYEV